MVRQIVLKAVLVVALAAPLAAGASETTDRMHENLGDEAHVGVSLMGGITDFTGKPGSNTSVGPSWGVNADALVSNLYGLEVGYEGSKNPLHDSRVTADNQSVWRQGAYGFGKVGPEISHFRPFAGAGLQGTFVNVTNGARPFYKNDLMWEVPVGAGVEYNVANVKVGVRGTWRWLFFDEWANGQSDAENTGGILGGQLTAGGTF
ncbi:MAG: outer membrane beta-barrel protein [Myxococcaceae bacterium]